MEKLTQEIIQFRDERNWKQFHNPKDLAISLSLEASELLECFQWKTSEQIELIVKNDKQRIEDEIADVGNYLLLLCSELDINLENAIANKLQKNREKYPVDKAFGSNKKYTEL